MATRPIEEAEVTETATEALPEDPPAVEKKKKKKKRRTSRGLRDMQRMERDFSRAAHHTALAVERGLAEYRKRRDRSSRKKTDGALWDMPRNAAEGIATTMREASRVPVDMVRAFDTKTARRAVRFGTRMLMMPFSR